jgi:RNA polymerase primary sigma factor
MEMDSFTRRLRLAIARKGLTQQQLAEELGVSQAAVSQWTTGRKEPGRENLSRIARALGATRDWLAYGQGSEPMPDLDEQREEYQRSVSWVFRSEPPDEGRDYGNSNLWTVNWDINTLVRELNQNSIDVPVDPDLGVGIEFRLIRLTGTALTNFLRAIGWEGHNGLEQHIRAASVSGQKLGTVLRGGLEDLGDPPRELMLLRFDDWGAQGLTGPEAGGEGNFAALARNNLHSNKQGANAGGSYGLGKAVLWRASRLATVMFRSDLAEPMIGDGVECHQARIIGRSDLAWHQIDHLPFAGPGWYGHVDEVPTGTRAISVCENLALAFDLHLERDAGPFAELAPTGTSILVIGFNDPASDEAKSQDDLAADIARATIRNFWPAIEAGTLRVRVSTWDGRTMTSSRDVTAGDDRDTRPFVEAVRTIGLESAGGTAARMANPGDVVVQRVPLTVPRKKAGENRHQETEHHALLVVRRATDEETNAGLIGHLGMYRGRKMIVRYDRLQIPGGLPFHAILLCGEAAGDTAEDQIAERFLRMAEPPEHNDWRVTPDMKVEYAQGGGTALRTLLENTKQQIRELVRPEIEDSDEGPQGLRELLRIAGDPPPPVGKPTLNLDPRQSAIDESGRWTITGSIRVTDGRAWRVTPVLRFVGETGGGQKVDWSIDVDSPAEVEGAEILIPAGTRSVTFLGISDPASHPVSALECAVAVDLRNARPADGVE